MTLALNLAQALNCEEDGTPCGQCISCQKIVSGRHADVQIVGLTGNGNLAEGKLRAEIGIDQIREIQHSTSLPPFEGKYRVIIVEGAELLSTEAANCLLKTLEEPVGDVLFILLTTNERLLPATVVSRCQRLELFPLAATEVEAALTGSWDIEPQKAKLLARLSHGCLGWALSAALDDGLLQQRADRMDRLLDIISGDYDGRFAYANQLAAQFSQNRALVQGVLDLWIDWWRDLLLVKVGYSEAITNIDQLGRLVEVAEEYTLVEIRAVITGIQTAGDQLRQNANPRLVLEVLMLDIPRKEGRSQQKVTAVKYG
jgi:DNA polymerase-3 subunit delta'